MSYKSPTRPSDVTLGRFSDASRGGVHETYGQRGSLTGLRVTQGGELPTLFHAIGWSSSKQKISFSSFGSDSIAAGAGDDGGFDLKCSFIQLFPHPLLKHDLLVDSKSLYETITTLHHPREYSLHKTVARMRDAFEAKELNIVRWIPGVQNFADALTKRSPALSERINVMLVMGRWDLDLRLTSRLDSEK